jgi:hypothetical protein
VPAAAVTATAATKAKPRATTTARARAKTSNEKGKTSPTKPNRRACRIYFRVVAAVVVARARTIATRSLVCAV